MKYTDSVAQLIEIQIQWWVRCTRNITLHALYICPAGHSLTQALQFASCILLAR